MAYSCTISIDPIHKEIIFLLQDCSDVINTLHLIQKEMVNILLSTFFFLVYLIPLFCE